MGMVTNQPTTNQDTTRTEIQPRQASPTNNALFIVVVIIIFMTAMITGLAVYFWQESANHKIINNLKLEISSLKNHISTIESEKLTPKPTQSPVLPPTDDATVSWKIYQNDEYGYSVYHPSNWKIIEAKPPNTPDWPYDRLQENQLHQVRFSEEKPVQWQGSFVISVNKNLENYNTENWASNYFRPLGADPTTNLAKRIGETSIDGNIAYKFSVFAFDSSKTVIGLVTYGRIYTFSFTEDTPNDPDLEIHQEIYNRILSSFKFTE